MSVDKNHKKADKSGGNGDIFFDEYNLTAKKVLRNTSTKEKKERFIRELKVLEMISMSKDFANIVEILEVNIDENNINNAFVLMKKYDGNLSELFFKTKGNVKLVLELILPIIRVLRKLSQYSPAIYHRDLKPENILYLENEGTLELYLTDFGICHICDEQVRLTPENIAVGSRMFLAPEYEIGRVEDVNEKGDIFSIGKIIWTMINGENNSLMPSNLWFINEFDLTKKFSDKSDMIAANYVISSCLSNNPDERCSYDKLEELIKKILDEDFDRSDIVLQYRVKAFQAKRTIELLEITEKNKILVNYFSKLFIEVLEELNREYKEFHFIEILLRTYKSKSKDGIEYTNINVVNNSMHYLYSENYDIIYFQIQYFPAMENEKYANLQIDYSIRRKRFENKFEIVFDNNSTLICKYNGIEQTLDKIILRKYLETLIMNYIA